MLLSVWNNRDSTVQITVCDAAGDAVVLQSDDYMRVKIGHEQGDPVLDIKAGEDTTNGSGFPNTNPFVLTLARADLAKLNRGIWNLEVSLYDSSTEHFYFAQEFQLEVRGSQGGNI